MASDTVPGTPHRWQFLQAGGLDLVRLETAGDFRNLPNLDQKLWTALACPVKGLEFDETTLALVDVDGDGRVRAPEVCGAVKWICDALDDPSLIVAGTDSVPLAAIKDAKIAASAREILASLGKADAESITLADAADTKAVFSQTMLNGDGVITAATAGGDETVAQAIADIIATQGAVPDRSGAGGIDTARIEAFFTALAAFEAWSKKAEDEAGTVLPLGEATAGAVAALDAIRTKVDDYFSRTRLAAFDSRAIAALNRQESDYLALAAKDLSISNDEIASFPLARIEAGKALPLQDGLNPAWAAAVAAFRDAVATPVLGVSPTSLTEQDWKKIKSVLAPYEAWVAAKDGASVASLGLARARELLGGNLKESLLALVEEDRKLAPEFEAIVNVEKLVRYCRDLHGLLTNFVSFSDFYNPRKWATFQAGTLYLDSRSCDLCIRVDGPNPLAAMSKAYVVYCKCTRPGSTPMTIAACFTQGDSDYLFPGRNGVFYDRKGRDWDAVITSIVDNPISVRQAFWSPYKKFLRMIEEQVAKRAAAADAASQGKLAGAADSAANADKAQPAAPKKPDVGTVAAIGVVITGAISALTLILGYIFGMKLWHYPLVLLGIILVISGPAMIIAALKLRQRTLGPILDGNGWAINGRVRINIPFGTSLTKRARLPEGAEVSARDPFADKGVPWGFILLLAVLAGAAAVWIRWDHNQRGHYFWQTPPAQEAGAPAAEPAPAEATP